MVQSQAASVVGRYLGVRSGVRRQQRWSHVLTYVGLAPFVVFFLFPFYYMLVTSFKTNEAIASQASSPWLVGPADFTLGHYEGLLYDTSWPIYLLNTVIVTALVVVITMAISILAAYSLSRLKFFGSGVLSTGVFLIYLVPETLLFIPLFQIVGALGVFNSIWALVLVYPTLTVPFCTWILIGYFSSVPRELDEAALIDGASYFQMLYKVFIPVTTPGIVAAVIFSVTVSWAAFIYPLAFIFSDQQMVLTVGTVTTLVKGDVFHWGGLMAGGVLAAAPPLILYVFLMDYYVAGLTAGATKG